MQIICHRGYWKCDSEKNSLIAFKRSFSMGLGTETDIRDFNGKLVISHDVATKKSITLEKFFEIYKQYAVKTPLALNIKADGIRDMLMDLLKRNNITDYFVFDMSIPEQVQYIKQNFPTLTRQSEYEPLPAIYKESRGVWLDCFTKEWYAMSVIDKHLKNDKMVFVVSPELHKREYKNLWNRLLKSKFIKNKNLILCTDIPGEAERFFYGKN